jgi:hypothetical protein
MYRRAGQIVPVFFSGNGTVPGTNIPGTGNVYTLDVTKLTDDDYGQINPFYTTYFMPGSEQETTLQLGGGRKLLQYVAAFVSGLGNMTITPLCDTLANNWTVTVVRTLGATPKFDLECGGGSAQGQRIALKFSSSPATGTDNSFTLQRVTAWMKPADRLVVRGSAS